MGDVFEEHRMLNARTRALAELAGREESWERLDAELEELALLLAHHFRGEEAWLDDMTRRSDVEARQAAQIRRQHGRLQETMAELRRLAAEQRDWPSLRAGVLDWIDRLVAHESSESRLFMGTGLTGEA